MVNKFVHAARCNNITLRVLRDVNNITSIYITSQNKKIKPPTQALNRLIVRQKSLTSFWKRDTFTLLDRY